MAVGTTLVLLMAGCAAQPKAVFTPVGFEGTVLQAQSGDSLRVLVPGNKSEIETAVIIASTNLNTAGRAAVMTAYATKDCTRHVIMYFYTDTSETQYYTYVNVRLADVEAADPTQVEGHKAKMYLDKKYAGATVYVDAKATPQGCFVGTVCTRKGERISQEMLASGLVKPGNRNQKEGLVLEPQPGYSYTVLDADLAGKLTGPIGTMPVQEKPAPPEPAATPKKEKPAEEPAPADTTPAADNKASDDSSSTDTSSGDESK
jgi:endonuclease YncB( thermonuclease family)